MKNRLKRIIITTGALLMMTMAPISQANPLGQYLNTITAQAAELNQSPRWHADSNGVWYLKDEAGTGNVVNSWFQDLDGSWYLLAPNDGHMYAGLIHDTLTDKWYYCQTEHDGYYGRMAHVDGVYTVNNQQIHLTFNQNHDGTFGAITSGLSSLQSTGVASQDVAGLPTESTGANTGGSGQSVDLSQEQSNNGGLTDLSSGAERIPLAPTDKSPIGTKRDGYTLHWNGYSYEDPYWSKDAVQGDYAGDLTPGGHWDFY
jgi:hypothetical protein